MRAKHPVKVWGAAKTAPLQAKKMAAAAMREKYREAQKKRKSAQDFGILTERQMSDTYSSLEHELPKPNLKKITRDEAIGRREERAVVLSDKSKRRLKRQIAKGKKLPEQIPAIGYDHTMVSTTILSQWEVTEIIARAVNICINAYIALSTGGSYYENVMQSPKLNYGTKMAIIDTSRAHTVQIEQELNRAIQSEGEYRVAYRIESVAYEFYKMEEYYIYRAYEEESSQAWYFIFTTLYKSITGDDLPLYLEQELTQYRGAADSYLDELEMTEFM